MEGRRPLPREAAHKTMDEVSGALIAIALVLVRRVRADHVHPRHFGRSSTTSSRLTISSATMISRLRLAHSCRRRWPR